jgi:transcriptional regulator with GAF, ATPase, and Fis domain
VSLLASHFLKRAAKKFNKSDCRLTQGDIERLQAYRWPGNIRELENVIERAVIVAQQGRLRFDLPITDVQHPSDIAPTQSRIKREVLTDAEQQQRDRENIIAALKASNGKIFGPRDTTELLCVKPTTLASRMKRLGVVNPVKKN